jgi:hypothetical protein
LEAPLEGFAVSVTVPPIQIGPLLDGTAVGIGFTVTVVVAVAVHPEPGVVTMTV